MFLGDKLFRVVLIAICVIAVASAEAEPPLPPGYRLPKVQLPTPSPHDAREHGGLRLVERGRIEHTVQLDRSLLNWAGDALRITVGYRERWSPDDYYALLPRGYEAEPDKAVAFISTKKIKFERAFDPERREPLRSVNHANYTLYADGPYVVVAKGAERRWYFSSPDDGQTWRIDKLEQIKHPGLFTAFEYNDQGDAVALVFHTGDRAEIKYDAGVPIEIRTPFGEMTTLKRNAAGFVEELVTYQLQGDGTPERRPAIRYLYQRDAESRIIGFTDRHGVKYAAEYKFQNENELKTQAEIHTTLLRRPVDNVYWTRRDTIRDTGEWLIEKGVGKGDGDHTDAQLSSRSHLRVVSRKWALISRANAGNQPDLVHELDESGNTIVTVAKGEVSQKKYDTQGNLVHVAATGGKYALQERNSRGQVMRIVEHDGREVISHYDSHSRLLETFGDGIAISYEYLGNHKVQINDGTSRWLLMTDEWMRPLTLTASDGTAFAWAYDAQHRLSREVRNHRGGGAHERRFDRDTTGKIEHEEVFFRERLERRRSFSYLHSGRLRETNTEGRYVDRFMYDPSGRVVVHTRDGRAHRRWTYRSDGTVRQQSRSAAAGP